jgi:hypothetical protein
LFVLSLRMNPFFNSYIKLLHFAIISDTIMRCKYNPVPKFLTG